MPILGKISIGGTKYPTAFMQQTAFTCFPLSALVSTATLRFPLSRRMYSTVSSFVYVKNSIIRNFLSIKNVPKVIKKCLNLWSVEPDCSWLWTSSEISLCLSRKPYSQSQPVCFVSWSVKWMDDTIHFCSTAKLGYVHRLLSGRTMLLPYL